MGQIRNEAALSMSGDAWRVAKLRMSQGSFLARRRQALESALYLFLHPISQHRKFNSNLTKNS